ncbi:MAG: ABC transporter permease [Methanoregula sp.]|uniref:ABC transporter permease n=1 Tax=Methanoregula sp. TaxID=2052170 RepID=UPI0025F87327|nr:ABC transporter permease [Methanoregula sp.]MCK9630588.1 ABC transporter permease [Methanoregula sp.]
MTRNAFLWISVAILALYFTVALLAPFIAPYGATEIVGAPLQPPDRGHLFGTNDVGQDIFSQLVYGSRVTLIFGFCSALLSVSISTCAGIVLGYYGGNIDEVVCRILDILMPIPIFPLLIVLTTFFNPGVVQVSILMGVLGSIHGIRLIRAPALSLAETPFIEGARSIGATDLRIMSRHILPNLMPVVTAKFVSSSQHYLVMGVGLSFIGLWDTMTVDWGSMIQNAYSSGALSLGLWWWILPPGIAVVGISLALALAGYSLEESFNPRTEVNRI